MNKIFFLLIFFIVTFTSSAQKIGEFAKEKPSEDFPDNSWGVDIMFGEGGFGFGTFLRKELSQNFKAFVDFSISEAKDDREVEYYDYFGRSIVFGKKNRVFMMPINFGLHYRLFSNVITDNLRPYISLGAGPNFVLTTPYEQEFFRAFGDSILKVAVGGYVGFGANFGLSKSNLVGLNIRYYVTKFFDHGVETLDNTFKDSIGSFYISINVGIMY